jgi:hypothetical protein
LSPFGFIRLLALLRLLLSPRSDSRLFALILGLSGIVICQLSTPFLNLLGYKPMARLR